MLVEDAVVDQQVHGSAGDGTRVLAEARRVVRAGGRLILVQPKLPVEPGWITLMISATSRFSLTVCSAALSFIVPLYLRSPTKLRARQMLVITTRGAFNA
jgi:hypothetical protein